MAWVNVKGHRYYRRSKRVGGRVVTEHVGRGVLADLDARYDRESRDLERRERVALWVEGRTVAAEFAPLFGLDDFTSELVAALAHRQGWHRPKRQWRRKRGATVEKFDGLRGRLDRAIDRAAALPLLAPDTWNAPEADRATLAAAAAGDPAALAAAEPYFRDPATLCRWGDPIHAARCWLVSQASSDNRLVHAATHRQADALRDGLGWAAADALSRMAILRVVNNWLAVGVLEAKANRVTPGHPSRLPIERALTQADRRLMQAVRTLAVLRGVRCGDMAAQLTAPTRGEGE